MRSRFFALIVAQKCWRKNIWLVRKNSGDERAVNSLSQATQQRSGMCSQKIIINHISNIGVLGINRNIPESQNGAVLDLKAFFHFSGFWMVKSLLYCHNCLDESFYKKNCRNWNMIDSKMIPIFISITFHHWWWRWWRWWWWQVLVGKQPEEMTMVRGNDSGDGSFSRRKKENLFCLLSCSRQ